MTHIDCFKKFFKEKRRGTADDICRFLVDERAHFKCAEDRRVVSVNRQISRECGKKYPTGIVKREMNSDGIFEYFTE